MLRISQLNGENQLPKILRSVKFADGIEITNAPSLNAA